MNAPAPGLKAHADTIPVFSRNSLDRAGLLRENPEWIAERLSAPTTRFLPVWMLKGRFRVQPHMHLGWVEKEFVNDALESGATCVFLGLEGDSARFAIDIGDVKKGELPPALLEDAKFIDMRMVAAGLPAEEAGIAAQARSLLAWHRFHGFCARCGSETAPSPDGYSRKCKNSNCASQHFPRTDPVTIMMVTKGDKVLLGRQPIFTPGTWSCLAGFVEAGETVEDAARREILEEAGIIAGDVRYVASQPWPYPSSLMFGLHAEALSEEITIDTNELDDARWFSRDELKDMVARARDPETFRNPSADKPHMPAPVSLAYFMANKWLAETE